MKPRDLAEHVAYSRTANGGYEYQWEEGHNADDLINAVERAINRALDEQARDPRPGVYRLKGSGTLFRLDGLARNGNPNKGGHAAVMTRIDGDSLQMYYLELAEFRELVKEGRYEWIGVR